MKIFKWNIDKDKASLSYKVNKAIPNRVISYETLDGEKVVLKSSSIRKQPKHLVKFGHVISDMDLK